MTRFSPVDYLLDVGSAGCGSGGLSGGLYRRDSGCINILASNFMPLDGID